MNPLDHQTFVIICVSCIKTKQNNNHLYFTVPLKYKARVTVKFIN